MPWAQFRQLGKALTQSSRSLQLTYHSPESSLSVRWFPSKNGQGVRDRSDGGFYGASISIIAFIRMSLAKQEAFFKSISLEYGFVGTLHTSFTSTASEGYQSFKLLRKPPSDGRENRLHVTRQTSRPDSRAAGTKTACRKNFAALEDRTIRTQK
jgi:hypothetical protein